MGIEIFWKRPVHLGIVLAFLWLLMFSTGIVLAEKPIPEPDLPFEEMFRKELEKGFNDPLGFHYYFKDGFRAESPGGRYKIKVGGEARLDGGYLGANETLKSAFSDLPGWKGNFRELKVRLSGSFYENWKFQFDMDFANVRQIKDIWISYGKIPFLGTAKAGHTKEPFSLEGFMSNADRTFMEVALPVEAFNPGRNIGILCQNTALNDRMTWAAGYFLITGSFSDVTDATNYLSNAFGSALSFRVTGLPRYENDGKNLLHLGFSYSHQFRDDTRADSQLKLRAHPESRLTDDTFVNTGQFYTEAVNLFGYEAAMVRGPLSVQGELFHVFTNAESVGDPRFWGIYMYGSYCLTGEHRPYDRSKGIFKGVTPGRSSISRQMVGGLWRPPYAYLMWISTVETFGEERRSILPPASTGTSMGIRASCSTMSTPVSWIAMTLPSMGGTPTSFK